jgi:MATE family multidrug resistance protein
LRQTLQAHRQTFQLIVCVAAANVLNLALNVCLVFGHLGLPALGVAGSATATLISRWFMAIAMLCLGWQQLKPYLSRRAPDLFNVRPLYRMTALGLPIGTQMLLEWGTFSTINLLMGWIGVAQIGAHQVAANLVSLTHTVAWAVGAATTVLVGHAIGRGDPNAARRALGAGLTGILLFMCAATAAFVGMPQSLVGIYTNEIDVLRVAVFLLPIAAVFQLADGLQIGSAAFLRGVGDTRMPMVANLAGLWLLGVPASAWLAFGAGLGAPGLWLGLLVGLLAVATFMLFRVAHVSRGKIGRLRIDA